MSILLILEIFETDMDVRETLLLSDNKFHTLDFFQSPTVDDATDLVI